VVVAVAVAWMREGGTAVAVFDRCGGESGEGGCGRVGGSPLDISNWWSDC
jgi:hypothetical protein